MTIDCIVIGAGASGLMASIQAAENGANVCLIEKNKRIGKKLLMTGGGRCNVTNNRTNEEIIQHIIGNGKFLYSSLNQFSAHDIIDFFEQCGVKLKEEDHGRMFPVTDKSQTIVDALYNKLLELNVTILTNTTVENILKENGQIIGVKTNKGQFLSPSVIVATGGRSYPSTGSTGDGYRFAKKSGHTLSKLYATESPLISDEPFILDKRLQGLSLRNVKLSVVNAKGKTLVTHQMDILFTHFGLSGPAALRCSSFVNQELEISQTAKVVLDCFPEKTHEELAEEIKRLLNGNKKSIKNALAEFLPERLLSFLLENCAIPEQKTAEKITNEEVTRFLEMSKHFPINITKTFPIEKSFVTGGGVSLKEINPKTMESKLQKGLFFTGEVLDINGYTGGYNITCAFSTGAVAGREVAGRG
ncbi:hypothetical protein SAMN02745116_01355 [Pilibacter termitis]|uniref:Aminoacetone oxidase family FAD-binding enzyme n=2 Tax=Pilibacter termitis TaxID=263852 RepID=A0A1T4N973_9ENTE|nr:hypothetical protein SAMN02745116_01355 [Pilibacter termitis]